MADIKKALKTQINNIEQKTGKTLDKLNQMIKDSGLQKHGQIRSMLKKELDLGHGDANTVTSLYLNPPDNEDGNFPLDNIYAGKKVALRPIHEEIMKHIVKFGEFDESPKKTYVSLRTKKQFATIGPATNSRIEVGIFDKTLNETERLEKNKPGGMCPFKVRISDIAQVDEELIGWLKKSYESTK